MVILDMTPLCKWCKLYTVSVCCPFFIVRFNLEWLLLNRSCTFFYVRGILKYVPKAFVHGDFVTFSKTFSWRLLHIGIRENLKTGVKENKVHQIFRKANISYSLIRTCVCASEGKKCWFFVNFSMLCFLVTPVLRFVLLPYCRQIHLFRCNSNAIAKKAIINLASSKFC